MCFFHPIARFNYSSGDVVSMDNGPQYPLEDVRSFEVFDEPFSYMDDCDEYVKRLFAGENSDVDSTSHEITDERKSTEQQLSLGEELLLFFIMFNIPHAAMQKLLNILCSHNVNVPPTLYQLRQSNSMLPTVSFTNKQKDFAYLGIKENLQFCFSNGLLKLKDLNSIIRIKINIDGLPLFKSSPINLWPILLQIEDISCPLPIALFCGIGKPQLETFVAPLCNELKELMSVGHRLDNHFVKIGRVLFICDAPARSYLQCIKGHNGYNGCGYCRQRGLHLNDRMTFPELQYDLRTDYDYAQFQEVNQLSISPFAGIVPLFSSFPPEYMHLVCLGVVKKMFFYYFSYTKAKRLPCRLSCKQKTEISLLLSHCVSYIPREFQRKPRTISFLEHFKASEFRTYILYLGPIALKDFLPYSYYEHFLLLHYAIYVFASDRFTEYYDCASRCLEIFVSRMSDLFGDDSLIYNVHVLLHLSHFVKINGPLDLFSSFPFENYLSLLKRRIRTNNGIFQQSLNQLTAIRSLHTSTCCKPQKINFRPETQDSCAITNFGNIIVTEVDEKGLVCGFKLSFVRDLYGPPFYPSSSLGIGYYRSTSIFLRNCIPLNKAICIPFSSEYLIFPYAS
jgi:hypothetical protein